MSEVATILALIRDLDRAAEADGDSRFSYVEVMRWNAEEGGGGERDDAAQALVRKLLREKLGTFPVEEIGAAVLASLDANPAAMPV